MIHQPNSARGFLSVSALRRPFSSHLGAAGVLLASLFLDIVLGAGSPHYLGRPRAWTAQSPMASSRCSPNCADRAQIDFSLVYALPVG